MTAALSLSFSSLSLSRRPQRRRSRALDRRHLSCLLSHILHAAPPCTWWEQRACWENSLHLWWCWCAWGRMCGPVQARMVCVSVNVFVGTVDRRLTRKSSNSQFQKFLWIWSFITEDTFFRSPTSCRSQTLSIANNLLVPVVCTVLELVLPTRSVVKME